MNPLVSVVVPAHNVRNFLKSCIESISCGDYSNIELILVENGSNDGTAELAIDLAKLDSRIRLFQIPADGVATARNFGISKARGEYICFVDADDIVAKDYVSHLVTSIQKYDADISVALTVKTFNDESEITNNGSGLSKSFLGSSELALSKILLYKMKESSFSKLFKTRFLIDNDIMFNPELYVGEGFNFNVLAFSKTNRISISNKIIYYYRVSNPKSAMTLVRSDKLENGLSAMEVMGGTLKFSSENIKRDFSYAVWHTNFDFLMILLGGKQDKENSVLYRRLESESKKGFRAASKVNIGFKDKVKAYATSISPRLCALVFNKLRKRKFTL